MRALTLALIFAVVAGCGTTMSIFDSESEPSGPLTDNFDFLWEVTQHTLEKKGYLLDEDETDRGGRYMETRWRVSPAPFRYKGRRDRVVVKFSEQGDAGELGIDVHVQVQRNENLENPLEAGDAEWENTERDEVRTQEILFLVKNYFRDFGRSSTTRGDRPGS